MIEAAKRLIGIGSVNTARDILQRVIDQNPESEQATEAKALLEMLRKPKSSVLHKDPELDFTITEDDVDRAIAQWDKRMPGKARGILDAEEIE